LFGGGRGGVACGGLGMNGCGIGGVWVDIRGGGVGRVGMGWDVVVKDLGMYGGVYFLVVL